MEGTKITVKIFQALTDEQRKKAVILIKEQLSMTAKLGINPDLIEIDVEVKPVYISFEGENL